MDKKVEERAAQILKKARRNYKYDIPYLAGYSKDAKTLYVDRHVPTTFSYKSKHYNFHKFLLRHESVEKAAIIEHKLGYKAAHKIARRAEYDAVKAAGIPLKFYRKYCGRWIKRAGHEKLNRVPPDLDLLPYRAFKTKEDKALLKQMKCLMK
jgi:hypothetical protein